jgi:hypothetical protein
VEFALANPALYVLMTEPRPEGRPQVATQGAAYLQGLMRRIAEAGRLAVPEALAFELFGSAGQGVSMILLGQPEAERDPALSRAAREAAIAAITTDAPAAEPGPAGAAIALRAAVPALEVLSDAEKVLLSEWLDRIAAHPSG